MMPENQAGEHPSVKSRQLAIETLEGWIPWAKLKYNGSTLNTYTLLEGVSQLYLVHPEETAGHAEPTQITINALPGEIVKRIRSDSYTDWENDEHKLKGHRLVKYTFTPANQNLPTNKFWIKDRSDLGGYSSSTKTYSLTKDLKNCFYQKNPEPGVFTQNLGGERNPLLVDYYVEKQYCKTSSDLQGKKWIGIPIPPKEMKGQVWHRSELTYDITGWIEENSSNYMTPYDWPGFYTLEESKAQRVLEVTFSEEASDHVCDVSDIIAMVDANGDNNLTGLEVQQAIKNSKTSDRLKGVVVHFPTEWHSGSDDDSTKGKDDSEVKSKWQRLEEPPWKLPTGVIDAFCNVFKDLTFMQKIDAFKDNPPLWYFHPIAFVEHLKRVTHEAEKQLLLTVIKEEIKKPDVQPGFPDANGRTNVTWCNRAAMRIIDRLGYDYSKVLNKNPYNNQPDINWTKANDLATNVNLQSKISGSGYEKIKRKEARNFANQGIPILAAANNSNGSGHVGIVAPTQNQEDLLIGQAGSKNGIFSIDSCFGSLTVHLYTIPIKN